MSKPLDKKDIPKEIFAYWYGGIIAEIIILIVGITLTVVYYRKMNKALRITAITLLSLSPFIVFGIIYLITYLILISCNPKCKDDEYCNKGICTKK